MSLQENNKIVWILGLMHSGTTILWRSFRKDRKLFCLDEPLSGLSTLPKQNGRRSHDEFIAILEKDPRLFWEKYAPVHPLQELDSSFNIEQEEYLRFLFDQSPYLVIDETKLHLHLSALAKLTPNARIVHLYRRASAFATSHLRPNWSKNTSLLRRIVRRLRREHDKRTFWTRPFFPPGLLRGNVISCHPKSKFGLMLADADYDTDRIMVEPALVRLLAYWHFHFHFVEHEGPRLFGENFRSLRYEDFASHPRETMADLYDWLQIEAPERADYSDVHAPKAPYREGDERWRMAAKIAGFSDAELTTIL